MLGRGSNKSYSVSRAVYASPDLRHRRDFIADALKHYVPVTQETKLRGDKMPAVIAPEPPVDVAPFEPAAFFHPERDAAAREVRVGPHGYTSQLDPNGSPLGLHHTRRDRATEVLSLEARIHPAQAHITLDHRRRA
ncbi:hypothetical protein P5F04_16195, partial [Clostridium perfringens]|nr:hypothetical protein [Clostridium perfringens]